MQSLLERHRASSRFGRHTRGRASRRARVSWASPAPMRFLRSDDSKARGRAHAHHVHPWTRFNGKHRGFTASLSAGTPSPTTTTWRPSRASDVRRARCADSVSALEACARGGANAANARSHKSARSSADQDELRVDVPGHRGRHYRAQTGSNGEELLDDVRTALDALGCEDER